jgi:phosphate transport system protein
MMTENTIAGPKVGREVDHLRQLALQMGGLSESILEKSLQALWNRDAALARTVAHDDLAIDRLDVEVDHAVMQTLALLAPVARDLRQVLAVKTMATDLERVGDLARNIAGCAERLAARDQIEIPTRLRSLASDCQRLLSRSLQAFADLDATQARSVLEDDDAIDEEEDRVIRDCIQTLDTSPGLARQEIDFIFVAQSLERIADHATNIAEDVILATEALNLKHFEKLST